jgi:hypothetical protein
MKKTVIIAAALAAVLASCKSGNSVLATDSSEASWTAFCREYGYNASDSDNEAALDAYLDCWRGSMAEEKALAAHGITKDGCHN